MGKCIIPCSLVCPFSMTSTIPHLNIAFPMNQALIRSRPITNLGNLNHCNASTGMPHMTPYHNFIIYTYIYILKQNNYMTTCMITWFHICKSKPRSLMHMQVWARFSANSWHINQRCGWSFEPFSVKDMHETWHTHTHTHTDVFWLMKNWG